MVYKKVDKEAEFFEKVDKTDSCWLWNGRKDRCGYGVYYANKFMHKAHRYCYEITNKLKIGKQIAMHTCDTPNCVNPDHIKLGTHTDNQKDKVNKNRQAKGEKIAMSKLTQKDVFDARNIYKNEKVTYKQLAAKYGVCKDTMQKAIRGINWSHNGL